MPNSKLEKVIWGAPSFWIERFPLYCGCHLGFFRDQGIELEIWYSYGGPEMAQAVAAGDIHIGEMGLPPFLTAYSQGLPARIIGSSTIQQLDHYLVGVPSIDRIADLAGKRIGILSHGSCDDYFLRHILQSHGIDPETAVELVPLGTSYGSLQVFAKGEVDAAFMVEPGVAAGESAGLVKVIARVGDYFSRFQWGIILASNRWLNERIELLTRIMTGFRNACSWIHRHPADTLKLGCDIFKVSEAIFQQALLRDLDHWEIDARIDAIGLQNALKVQKLMGGVISGIDIKKMVRQT